MSCELDVVHGRPSDLPGCFIRTLLGGWAYGALYRNGYQRFRRRWRSSTDFDTATGTGTLSIPLAASAGRAGCSTERASALDGWLDYYNHRRPHGALSHKPPIARLNELNNVPGFYT
jgi:hypothetical protein